MVDTCVGKPPLNDSRALGGDRTVGIHRTGLNETSLGVCRKKLLAAARAPRAAARAERNRFAASRNLSKNS